MESKPIGVAWFTNTVSTIGIVMSIHHGGKNVPEYQAHISAVSGIDKQWDIEIIIKWGNPFPLDAAVQVIKAKGKWLTKNPFNT